MASFPQLRGVELSKFGYSSGEHRIITAPVLVKEEDRGYDYEFIKPGPSEDCICAICHLVARNAHQSSCCGKIFCEVCINKLKKSSSKFKCPNCRQNFRYFKDIKTNREIQSLKIYCTNHKDGCLWEDVLQKVEEHIKTCPYQLIQCEKKCEVKIQRQLMQAHLTIECPNRNFMCIHCKEIGTWVFITKKHFDVCPDLLLPCSNTGCREKVKRRNLDTHQDTCPKRVVPCPYKNVGCTLTFKTQDIAKHKQEHVEKHLSLAIEKIEKLEIQQQIAPLVLKIERFYLSTPVRSQPFYTSKGGYKMSLLVKPNSFQQYRKTWVSCFINIMPGEYDDTLDWPFQGELTVELLNQLEDNNHRQHVVCFEQEVQEKGRYQNTEEEACKTKRTQERKIEKFISHDELCFSYVPLDPRFLSSNIRFLVNNTLYLRVNVREYSKTKLWLVTVPLESNQESKLESKLESKKVQIRKAQTLKAKRRLN